MPNRPLEQTHNLDASLSLVETRQVANDYTIRFDREIYQIARESVRAGLRGAHVRIETRLDGSLAVRSKNRYLAIRECAPAALKPQVPIAKPPRPSKSGRPADAYRRGHEALFHAKSLPVWMAAAIDRTRRADS